MAGVGVRDEMKSGDKGGDVQELLWTSVAWGILHASIRSIAHVPLPPLRYFYSSDNGDTVNPCEFGKESACAKMASLKLYADGQSKQEAA